MLLRITLLILAFTTMAAAQPARDLVKPSILADVSAVKAGEPFTVGVLLHVTPGWHVYWKNPGDSGRPTDVRFSLPDGFVAGELQYPVPSKIALPGDVINYGYEDEVMLLAQITPSKDLAVGSKITLSATVSWLVCSDVCIPGKATLDLTLPVAAKSTAVNDEIFASWRERIPSDVSHTPAIKSFSQHAAPVTQNGVASEVITLNIDWRQATSAVEFFPGLMEHFVIGDIAVKTTGETSQITFSVRPMAGEKSSVSTLPGVVAYTDGAGQRRGVVVSVDLPQPQ